MKRNYAPIVCFCYNRPDKIKKVLDALSLCDEAKKTDLIVFSDGARNIADEEKVLSVRKILHKVKGFKKVIIEERKTNYGLSINLIDGIDRVLKQYDRAIICEDDIIVTPCFLTFMNKALDVYNPIKKIFTISATIPFDAQADVNSVVFGEIASCWGWAIWRDRWKLYEKNIEKSFNELRDMELRKRLNIDNRINIAWQIDANYKKERNSWAVYLNYACVKHNKLNVYPPRTIVKNIGQDGSGIHAVCSETIQSQNIDVSLLNFPTKNITDNLQPFLNPILDKIQDKQDIEKYNNWIYNSLDKKEVKQSKIRRIFRILRGKE